MNKYKIKEQLRKVRWQTEKELGKKLGKKDLVEVQKVVMEMNPTKESKEFIETTWKEKYPQTNSTKLSTLEILGTIGKRIEK